MLNKSKLSKTNSGFANASPSRRDIATRLQHKPSHINFLETTTTDVDFLPNCNIQKDYVTPMYFGDDLDIQQNIINDLGGASPSELDLDAAHLRFKKFMEHKRQTFIEKERLDSLQEKLDRFTNEKCFEEDLASRNEATLKQISLDLSRGDEALPQNLRILQDIDSKIDEIGSKIAYKRTQTSISREMASRRLEEASRNLENLATDNLNQMLDDEQQKIVDDIRFREMDHYVHQQIEAEVQKHLDESLKLLKNHLNSLKTGQLKESLNNLGIEPTSTANHLPSGLGSPI